MNPSRRQFLVRSTHAALGAAPLALAHAPARAARPALLAPRQDAAGLGYRPTVTPNGVALPFRVVDGVKVFHLVAEEVEHEFAPGMRAFCYGYNGRVHGPTIEAVEGDRVRIYVTNRLDVPTTTHWHGLILPNGMDGIGGLTQRPILPGETFKYEFVLRQHGTYMYHSHHDEMTQMALGMMGMFVIHPRSPAGPPPDRDYTFLLSEWKLAVGARRPDPNEMSDFNVLTFNAKIAPATAPIVARRGERVRIRIGNLSAMDHHPIHLHGHAFRVVETDGGPIEPAGQWPEVSVLVPVGSTRTIEFVADNPGDWALHCHMTHHVMTQMGHGIPNLVGVDPSKFDDGIAELVPEFDSMGMAAHGETDDSVPPNSLPMVGMRGPFGYITMSGMFTLLKVRDELAEGVDPGPYQHPSGTLALPASAEELRADGIAG
ncbi:MAG: copper oxidase [Planctomycetota bacterium]|nr:MAG: copper oxidase [Planctomycetota bacterium]